MSGQGVDVRLALQTRAKYDQMLNDPDLTGDVLLLAMAMLALAQQRAERSNPWPKESWAATIGRQCRPVPRDGEWWVRNTLGKDVPRHDFKNAAKPYAVCDEPMQRREGPCGKGGSYIGLLRDTTTGEGEHVVACSRHRKAVTERMEAARQLWIANGAPKPQQPNRGGVLARYFEADWPALWDWADPSRVRYEESGGVPAPTPPRPTLRLIRGEGNGSDA